MIPQSTAHVITSDWQSELARAIKNPAELLSLLGLSDRLEAIDGDILKQFPLRVTESYVRKMRYGDAQDPLLRQVFPLIDEGIEAVGFQSDPVGDHFAVKSPGILHKYHGRALLLITGACAIHCRYCFRRHFPYSDSNPLASQWQDTLIALKEDTSLSEIIFSGGDPLALPDHKLEKIIQDLAAIPHLKRLRIHTRLPVVLAKRITGKLCELLRNTRFNVVMVIHANHANELDDESAQALADLKTAGCDLLNQAVLLKGINDSVETLVALSERLSDVGVMPYYLHLLDKVKGASHFEVDDAQGIALINLIRQQLPGYLVPRLVREIAGENSKTIIA